MKVSELAKKLAQLDQSLEIYCYEEGPASIPEAYPGPFDLGDVSQAEVQMSRGNSGKPVLTIGSGSNTRKVAIIGITPDF